MPSTLYDSPSFIVMVDCTIRSCTTSHYLCPPKAPPLLDTDGSLEHDNLTLPYSEHPNTSSIVSTMLVSMWMHKATPPLT